VWDVPPDREAIPEGWSPVTATEGQNDYGEVGYGAPTPADGEHTYRFWLYALDTALKLPTSADRAAITDAATGHIIAKATLGETYVP
jgi:phosphatidylethanolamine-binding protein (PEBP) family uncharacterized protein